MAMTKYEQLYAAAWKTYDQLGLDRGFATLQTQIAAAGPEAGLWAAAFNDARYDYIQGTPDVRVLASTSGTIPAPHGTEGNAPASPLVVLVVVVLVVVFVGGLVVRRFA